MEVPPAHSVWKLQVPTGSLHVKYHVYCLARPHYGFTFALPTCPTNMPEPVVERTPIPHERPPPLDSAAIRRALLHARIRWFGVLILGAGLLLVGASALALPMGSAGWFDLVLAFLSSILGLAVFGTHNDTAMAILRDHRDSAHGIPERLLQEINAEFLYHRLDLADLRAMPGFAWFVTALAPTITIVALRSLLW